MYTDGDGPIPAVMSSVSDVPSATTLYARVGYYGTNDPKVYLYADDTLTTRYMFYYASTSLNSVYLAKSTKFGGTLVFIN
jgi:hypothetical protein